jgi:hypothetical protein
MGIRKMLARSGNENRIMEMHDAGFGPNQISGIFKDHGVDVSAKGVAGVIEAHDALSSKALPKSVVNAAIRASKTLEDFVPSAA